MTSKRRTAYFVEHPYYVKEEQGRRFKMVPDKNEDAIDVFDTYVRDENGQWEYLGKIERDRGRNEVSGYANVCTDYTEPWEYWASEDKNGKPIHQSHGTKRMAAVEDLMEANDRNA